MKKGFTILELLTVIIVLTVLMGITIPRLKKMQNTSNIAQTKKDLKILQGAVESYYRNHSPNVYFETTAMPVANYLSRAVPKVDRIFSYDPFGATASTEYNYKLSSKKNYYVIWSVGPDGISQTTAINNSGEVVTGGDDICVTNGVGC